MSFFTAIKNQTIYKSISNFFFGDANGFSMERRVFIAASFITLLAAIIGLIWNVYLGLPIVLNTIVGIFIILYFLLFYYSRYKSRFSPFLFLFTSLLFLCCLYVTNGGLNGPIPSLFIVYVAVFISISNAKHHKLTLIVTIITLVLLIIGEYSFLKELIIQYSNIETQEMDLSFGYIAALILCYLLISFYKNSITSKNEELFKINANKDMLFKIIAHDLSAPFNSILGFTEIMTDKTKNLSLNEFQKYSEIVNTESLKANELLKSLLIWGEIQMNRIQTTPEKVDLYKITNEIADFFEYRCTEKDIEISVLVPDEMYILADNDIMKTIMRNLISNAIKFTPHGGTIEISTEDLNHKYLAIIVKDNGIGMGEELIDNLFHYKTNTSRKGTDGEISTGLGLFIIKELVEKHGGTLTIESQDNQGSTFKFTVLKSN